MAVFFRKVASWFGKIAYLLIVLIIGIGVIRVHNAHNESWARWDQNLDGTTTITDIWLWVGTIYHAPGDAWLIVVVNSMPKVATFLELSFEHFGGFGSGVVSFIYWVLIFIATEVFDSFEF